MTTLAIWILGGHSDAGQEQTIKDHGYAGWWAKHVAPAVTAIRRLGRDPIVIHRFPGAGFGSYRVTLADLLNVRGTDWAATVRKQTMAPFRWPWQAPRKAVEYRAYLPEPEGYVTLLRLTVELLDDARCGAYFEGVVDSAARAYVRTCLQPAYTSSRGYRFFGNEPVPDRANPIAARDPWIVAEKMLTDEGRDFKGRNWNPSWVPLAKGQRRTLIMDDAPTTMAAILEREAEGWEVACYAHRIVEMTNGTA